MKHQEVAVFLDRDGTVMEDVGFLADPSGIQLFPDAITSLRRLAERFALFVVTNQSGVANGTLTMRDVHRVNSALDTMLREAGIPIRAWYVCPHGPDDDCACRKPKSAFLEQAKATHGIDLARSFVLGDHPHDALTGAERGVRGAYLLTGHGQKHRDGLPAGIPVFACLSDATDWILAVADCRVPAGTIDGLRLSPPAPKPTEKTRTS